MAIHRSGFAVPFIVNFFWLMFTLNPKNFSSSFVILGVPSSMWFFYPRMTIGPRMTISYK